MKLLISVLILLFVSVAMGQCPDGKFQTCDPPPTPACDNRCPQSDLPLDYDRLSTLYHGLPVPLVCPVEVCHACRPQPPGTWAPILYPTPLRNLLFGSHRWQPDPNYRWEPGRWVPLQESPK